MKYAVLLIVALLTGCATSVPVTVKFPDPPGKLSTERCPNLKKLTETPVLSDIARTVTENYTTYYECAIKADAWQEWYEIQKRIFEGPAK
jgi:hypothetical protein